ncbi:Fe-S cluster assembly ATPase SufC, partial [Neptunomonas sp.]|uniref:Fe-S cluster assembly ATPase SufC n=1 Tax=Neptunomonas sp. TaxID=1971898 RepID=UPI0035633B25
MLTIKNLHASVDGKPILKGLDLEIKPGEVHAIMGPNGSGKSTLGHVLAGRPGYEITGGSIFFKEENLIEMETEQRARNGLFLAFQYPVEIPGVSNMEFLKAAVDALQEHKGEQPMDSVSFLRQAREMYKQMGLDPGFLKRGVNEGFSGGEKKRNELIQMLMLQPALAILDET